MGLRAALTRKAGRPGIAGRAAPVITGVDPTGEPLTVTWEGRGRTVLGFMTSSCRPCQTFWAALTAGAVLPGADFVAVTPGPETESRRAVVSLAPSATTVVMGGDAWFAYGAGASPWFAVVTDGRVERTGNCLTWSDLERLTAPD